MPRKFTGKSLRCLLLTFAALFFSISPALAEPALGPPEIRIEVLAEGEPAPFSGLLFNEAAAKAEYEQKHVAIEKVGVLEEALASRDAQVDEALAQGKAASERTDKALELVVEGKAREQRLKIQNGILTLLAILGPIAALIL